MDERHSFAKGPIYGIKFVNVPQKQADFTIIRIISQISAGPLAERHYSSRKQVPFAIILALSVAGHL